MFEKERTERSRRMKVVANYSHLLVFDDARFCGEMVMGEREMEVS